MSGDGRLRVPFHYRGASAVYEPAGNLDRREGFYVTLENDLYENGPFPTLVEVERFVDEELDGEGTESRLTLEDAERVLESMVPGQFGYLDLERLVIRLRAERDRRRREWSV